MQGRLGSVQVCNPADCDLPGLSVREGALQARTLNVLANTGGHTLLEHCISCALTANSPECLVLPEALRSKQLHHLHTGPHRGKPKSSRAASGANPSGRLTCRGGNKIMIEAQGQCG